MYWEEQARHCPSGFEARLAFCRGQSGHCERVLGALSALIWPIMLDQGHTESTPGAMTSGRGSELAEQSRLTEEPSSYIDAEDPQLYPVPSIAPPASIHYPHIFPNHANAAAVNSLTPQASLAAAHTPVHTPMDPEALYSPDHKKERQERQARRDYLKEIRATVDKIPSGHWWEVPGNANVIFAMRDYRSEDIMQGRRMARDELPFLFKAFEQGQAPPPRPGTKKADLPRAATIHEYLDWTVTASVPQVGCLEMSR